MTRGIQYEIENGKNEILLACVCHCKNFALWKLQLEQAKIVMAIFTGYQSTW